MSKASDYSDLIAKHRNDLVMAEVRVGSTSDQVVRWMLRRYNEWTDLYSISSGDQLNYQFDVLFFAQQQSILGRKVSELPTYKPTKAEGWPFPEVSELRDFHGFMRKAVDAILNKTDVTCCFHELQLTLGFSKTFGPILIPHLSNEIDLYQYILIYTLHAHAQNVRRCPHCNNAFLADRNNQTYCSPLCQNRAGIKRLRKSRRIRAKKHTKRN